MHSRKRNDERIRQFLTLPHQDQVPKRGETEKVQDQNDLQKCTESNFMEENASTSIPAQDSSQLLCVICEDPAVFIENGCGTEDLRSDDDDVKQLITLCKHMMPMNQDDIPKEIRREMFPLCTSCKELAKELWECEVIMEKIKDKIEAKVVQEVNLSGGPLLSESDHTDKRFMKLRSIIYEGYLNKLRLKKHERRSVRKTGRGTAATPSPFNIASNSSGNNEEAKERNATDRTPLTMADGHSSTTEQRVEVEEDEIGSSQLQCDVGSSVTVKVEEESSWGAEEVEFGDPLFEEEHNTVKVEIPGDADDEENTTSSSPNVPGNIPETQACSTNTRIPEGKLVTKVAESEARVLINWTRCTNTSETFMECSFLKCIHSVPFGTTKDEMNEAYKSMRDHFQQNHKEQAEQLAVIQRGLKEKDKPKLHPCPNKGNCTLRFADKKSVKHHEVVHRTCHLCMKIFSGTEMGKNPLCLRSHYTTCTQMSKKRNATNEEGDQGASSNKKAKN